MLLEKTREKVNRTNHDFNDRDADEGRREDMLSENKVIQFAKSKLFNHCVCVCV